MANIRINALPSEPTPSQSDVIPLDQATTRKGTVKAIVEAGRPAASQAEAEAGTDPTKAMTPLTSRQGLVAYATANLATAAQGAKADTAVQPARAVNTGTGLTGGGNLSADRTLALTAAVQTSLGKADTALQPLNVHIADIVATGTPGSANYLRGDGSWVTPAGAGDMAKANYDPTNKVLDVYPAANHTFSNTASGLAATAVQSALDELAARMGVSLQARVSLAAGVAVTESDISGATTVYVVPSGHSNVVIHDGIADRFRTYSAPSLTLDATNALSGKNFDVWLAFSGGNVVCGYGPDWTAGAGAGSNTARGTGAGSTELELFNGRLVNKNAITLRNSSSTTYSIGARQATLAGGFRTSGNGITEDSASKRLVWSILPVTKIGKVIDTTASWNYSIAAFRQFNGSANNKFAYFQGLGGRRVSANAIACANSSTATARNVVVGVGIDSTSVNSATCYESINVSSASSDYFIANYDGYPGIGYHEIWPLEKGGGTDTQQWLGFFSGTLQTGMTCEIEI